MSLGELISIKEGEVISVVGSGGKTTLIYNLAEEFKEAKVLISTTTKMMKPRENQVDYFYCLDNDDVKSEKGRTFIASEMVNENKVSGDSLRIKEYIKEFDYSLVESDGSKRKPLKGWNDNEPVVLSETTKTIGIIPMHIIGEKVSEENIHRVEIFNSICGTKLGDEISLEVIADIISNTNGLFKNSIGEKILFLNRIEGEKSRDMALELLKILIDKENINLKFIGGSLKDKKYFDLKTF